jgi:predicted negative regulator of RcsB-dependent stress response
MPVMLAFSFESRFYRLGVTILAKGRISAQQLKHDPLMAQYLTTRSWVQQRGRKLVTGIVATAVIAAVALIVWMMMSRRERAAAESLSEAFKISAALVSNPIPATTEGYAFATEEEKNRRAFEAFEKAARDYPSYHGDLARYQAAVHQLNFDAPKAEATLKELAAKDSNIGAQARLALAQRFEAQGQLEEAADLYRQLKAKPGEVPPLVVDIHLARVYEAQGKTGEAIEIYFNVAKEARTAGVGTTAVTRLTILDPARLEQLPPPEPTSPFAGFR